MLRMEIIVAYVCLSVGSRGGNGNCCWYKCVGMGERGVESGIIVVLVHK